RGKHRVAALTGALEYDIASVVDEVNVVAFAAAHAVGPAFAVEQIVTGIANDRIGIGVAVALQVVAALQDQGFHVVRQPVMRRRENDVGAFAGVLEHAIAGIVDEVDVVAGTAEHGIGSALAVEEVVAGIAEQRIGIAVAVTLQVGVALQHQGFHVVRQPEV